MKAVKVKERRRKKRWQVAVLVRCALPGHGDTTFEMEMWAKDVNEKGLKLEWTKELTISQLHKDGKSSEAHNIRFDDFEFKKGGVINIQDLFYDDDGSPFIEGKVSWVKKPTASGTMSIGVKFKDPKKQPKALLGAFKDFLTVVKNPIDAIEKASRKK